MAETNDIKAEFSAKEAPATAVDAISEEKSPADAKVQAERGEPAAGVNTKASDDAAPVKLPPRAKRGRKPRAAAKPAPHSSKPTPSKSASVKAAPIKVAPMASGKPATQKIKTAPKASTKPVSAPAAANLSFVAQLKETPMDVTNSITDAVNSAQAKAKETFSKTSAAASEYGEFAKGNVEACVESGKILASGLQELGSKLVADGKSALETATSDMKALGGVKSPSDFFKLQSDILRRNFDTAIAYSSKNSQAMFKLTNEVIAPLSGRVTLAVEKLKKAA